MIARKKTECSDCQSSTVEGFILDMSYGGSMVSRWVKGKPTESWFSGIKTKGLECRVVETYRCIECGLLKSYATTEISVSDRLQK